MAMAAALNEDSQSSFGEVRTSRLGKNGPAITRVGFGTWAIGGPYEYGWGPSDDATSVSAILHAVERGVTWIDTAPAYGTGHSENVVGRAINQLSEGDRPLVFTKCGRTWRGQPEGKVVSDLRPDSIRNECEASLKRLGVDFIDLYQIHRPDLVTGTSIEDSWGTLADLASEGKVRHIGVSNFTRELLDRCEAIRHVDSLQPRLNIFDDSSLDLIEWCELHGTGVLAYSPMASGLLSGAFSAQRVAALADDDWRKRAEAFVEPSLSARLAAVDNLRVIATELDCTLPELAVAWVINQPSVTAAIVGARTPQQVDGWVKAANMSLEPSQLEKISAIGKP